MLTKRDPSWVEELQSSSDILVYAIGRRGLAAALQAQGFVPLPKRVDGVRCPNDHVSIGVPLARLDEAFTVIGKFPASPGPCLF